MCAAASLGSADEYAAWVRAYASAVAQYHDEPRAHELCRALLAACEAEGGGSGGGGGERPGLGEAAGASGGLVGRPVDRRRSLALGAQSARRLLEQDVLPALATSAALRGLVERLRRALQ